MDSRDFFISYNSADSEYANALNSALREHNVTTFFAGTDLGFGDVIIRWMEEALERSEHVIAICSRSYFKDTAIYSYLEHHCAIWYDAVGDNARLIPIAIEDIGDREYPSFIGMRKRLTLSNMDAVEFADAVIQSFEMDPRLTKYFKISETTELEKGAPEIFFVPRDRPQRFIGREQVLNDLHETLSKGRNAAVIQAISGLGGIGKTTLAAEYAHRFGTRGCYGGVWWVAAEAESSIVEGLAELARRVGCEERQSLFEMARAARDFLQTATPPWLVIFDNATDAATVRDWLPAGSARVMITSRARDFAGLAEVTELSVWDTTATADYLLRVTGRDDRAGAEALAESLGSLPLAANQAAAFLKGRPGIGFRQYIADFEKLLTRAKDEGNRGDYPETVFTSLAKSLEVLPEATQDLMCLLAWLSPDGVEEKLLIDTAINSPEFLPDPLGAALTDADVRADMVKAALDLSLLKTADEPTVGQVLIVHRVVQAVLRVWQRAAGKAGWDIRAAQIVDGLFPQNPDTDTASWPLCARLLPHARALAEHGPRQGAGAEALGRLLNQAGIFLTSRGDTEGAIEVFEPNVDLARSTYGEEHPEFATRLSNLAGLYSNAGRLDKAERGFLRVLEIQEKQLGPNDPSVAITLNNLGAVYWKRKEFAHAEPLFQRARGIMRVVHGELSPEHAVLTNSLGALYDDWAEQPGEATRRAEGQRLKDEALRIARAVRGERHPEVSTYLHNLAVLLDRQGDAAGAAARELRALAIMLSLGLRDHPDTQLRAAHLEHYWKKSGQGANKERLRELLAPEIVAVEAEMQAWVAEDPEHRHFGPPPFAEHRGKLD